MENGINQSASCEEVCNANDEKHSILISNCESFSCAEIKNQDNWPLNNKQEKYGNNCEVFAHNSISTGPGTRLSSTNKCAEVSKENMQMQEQNDDALFIENPKFSTPKSFTENSQKSLPRLSVSSILAANSKPRAKILTESQQINQNCMPNEKILSHSIIDNVLSANQFTDMDDSALVNALMRARSKMSLKIMDSKRMIEKSESGGSIDFGRVGNIRERSKNFQNIDFQKNNGSRLLLDSVRFPLSNSSLCDGARNEIRERCLSFDTTFVYFGFVDVHCQVNRFLRIRNRSNKNLNLLIQLKSNNKDSVFRLVDTEIMMLRPEDSHSIKILFEPKLAACFRDTLCIRVMNANHVNYSVPMMGSGGIANLQICQRAGINMLRDGSFVFSTQGYSSFTFDIKNKGVRDAFVRIVVFDKKTKKPFQNVEILPSDCITILRCKTQRCLLKFDSEAAVGHSESALSLISVSSSAPSYYVHLLWGEEAQRRRLKRYEANKKIDLFFNGYTFTKPKFLNEEQSKITASESIEVGHYDNDSFELGLRIISISLVDNRLNNFSSRQYEEQSENRQTERSIILDPDATLRPGCNNIVVEDVSYMLSSSGFHE